MEDYNGDGENIIKKDRQNVDSISSDSILVIK